MADNSWSPEDDEIVLTMRGYPAAEKLGRTYEEVVQRRFDLRIKPKVVRPFVREIHKKMADCNYWTPQDDDIALALPPKDAADLLGRSLPAVIQRRHTLRRPKPQPTCKADWTREQIKLLRREYPTAEDTRDLLPLFPGLTVDQLTSKARRLKIKRLYCGKAEISGEGNLELVEQIKMRAKQDGIPIYKLDAVLNTGSYFKYNAHRRKANLHAVARAVEFFGGTLVVDWRDR
jgi:hypothetical protein